MINHQPVFLQTAISFFLPRLAPNSYVFDATFGGGGHTRALLESGFRVIATDYDTEAIREGEQNFASEIAQHRLILVQANFAKINQDFLVQLRDQYHFEPETHLVGALFDFGTNSNQLLSTERGLSFNGDGPLDMRLDSQLQVTAHDLLVVLSEKQLTQMLRDFGGENLAKPIAKAIVNYRQQIGVDQAFQTTSELIELIIQVKQQHHQTRSHLHPATKTFQALRIAVNDELGNIAQALPQIWSLLSPQSRLVAISFHEGEDRLVKNFFKNLTANHQAELLTKHPLTPDFDEIKQNPRARSAKLRVAEKK